MAWALIVFYWGTSVAVVPMASQDACKVAAETIEHPITDGFRTPRAHGVCVYTGGSSGGPA